MSLEGDTSGVCKYDIVTIYDGDSAKKSNLRGKFCGTQVPSHVLRSTSNKMLITFTTDHNNQYSGFSGGFYDISGNDYFLVRKQSFVTM